MRAFIWRYVWGVVFSVLATRFEIRGDLPTGPIVLAANHSSHVDTPAIQHALSVLGRSDVLVAGAEDYFFRRKWLAQICRAIGVFPFPRHGPVGIDRARRVLEDGGSVLIYPQGTRNGGPFRSGVAHIPGRAPVVPVNVSGTGRMLPKGSWRPRRTAISIDFRRPVVRDPDEPADRFARRLELIVLGASEPAQMAEETSIVPQEVSARMTS